MSRSDVLLSRGKGRSGVFARFGAGSPGGRACILLALLVISTTTVSGAVPGFFRGAGYVMMRGPYGENLAQSTVIAECSLFPDGRFRFASAPGTDGNSLWTRGSWRVRGNEADGSEWLELSCLDIGGVLIARQDEKGLELVYRPKPFHEQRFRLQRTGAPPAQGSGWPLRAEFPEGAPGIAGVYLGRMTVPDGNSDPAVCGEGVFLVSPDGRLEGAMRVPMAGGNQPVLTPVLGLWRKPASEVVSETLPEADHTLTWDWGKPSPAGGWERPALRGMLDSEGERLTARASLAGMPLDQTQWRRLPQTVFSQSADASDDLGAEGSPGSERSEATERSGESVYALLQIVSQSGSHPVGDPARLFPLRLDFTNNRLLMRSPDDPDSWLAFSLDSAPDGRLLVNRDGKDGSLVRLGNGRSAAFVVRTPPTTEGIAFPSTRIGEYLVLTLDLTIAPLTSGKAGGDARRDRVVLVARRVDGGG